jgi:energy-coupling factor transport system ATP-binding protein
MITVTDLTHIYSEGTPWETKALERLSFRLEREICLGIVGESGAGKSTLAHHLAGILPPTSGSVLIDGLDMYAAQRSRDMRKKVGLMFQCTADQLFEESVFKEISFALRQWKNLTPQEIEQKVKAVCSELFPPLANLMDRSPFELSEGEKNMVILASILVADPEVLILDEPCAGLDPGNRSQVLHHIETLHRRGKTLVILTSQSEGLIHLFDRMMFLHEGKIIAQGTLQDLLVSREIDPRVVRLLPPLNRMLLNLRAKGIQINPSLHTPSSISEEIHRLLEKQRKDP